MTYPITEVFAWVVDDPTGTHGICGFRQSIHGEMQAVSSRRHVIDKIEQSAKETAELTGRPVMLQRFVLAETIKTV